MKPSDWAWLALLVGIASYEVVAPPGELMSEGWDRYLMRFPVSGRVIPLFLTLHVINALPRRFDPVTRGLDLLRAAKGNYLGRRN